MGSNVGEKKGWRGMGLAYIYCITQTERQQCKVPTLKIRNVQEKCVEVVHRVGRQPRSCRKLMGSTNSVPVVATGYTFVLGKSMVA